MHTHGDNLRQKETGDAKYADAKSRKHLREIRTRYDQWRRANEELRGPLRQPSPEDAGMIARRVLLFSKYKDFLDQQHFAEHFDARSNLHSSLLEEFIYLLFRDLVKGFTEDALIGKAHTFKDIFFVAPNFDSMVSQPHARIEEKDHDFVIGVNISASLTCKGKELVQKQTLQIPAVAIECKTYLDKTMLEGASTAAEQLKTRNPNAIYIVVAEWLKLTGSINLKKFKVDQIYILRKQRNTDREFRYLPGYQKNPIHADVVHHLFETVRDHLTRDWQGGVAHGLERGYLL